MKNALEPSRPGALADGGRKPSAVAGTARSGRFEGRSGSEKSTEHGSSVKTVASQPRVGLSYRCQDGQKGNPGLDKSGYE